MSTVIAMLVDIKQVKEEQDGVYFEYMFRRLSDDALSNGAYKATITFDSFWETLGLAAAGIGMGITCGAAGAFTLGIGGVACAASVGGYIASAGTVITNGDDELFTFG